MQYALIFVAIVLSPVLADLFDITETCGVQYLKEKGKLSSNFESAIEPTEMCLDVLPDFIQSLRSAIDESVKKVMPHESKCLMGEIDYSDVMDQFLAINVIRMNKILSENLLTMELKYIRAQLKHELENIALQCQVDDKNFVELFNYDLGIRNETLAALQHSYCVTKSSVDNRILELENYEPNPYGISTDDINCTSIIDIDRINAEKGFADRYITTAEEMAAKDCIMQLYRNEKRYEWVAAFRVLQNIDLVRKTKESDLIRVLEKLNNSSFFNSIYDCTLPSE
ncbi:hypothetical protein HA402_015128 [Bradysia odoriphaga]|nr:hypothetical protein HA402_015128 [Bradysia odoriphaga]